MQTKRIGQLNLHQTFLSVLKCNTSFKESIKLFESDNLGQISKACFELKDLCFRIW